jgi:hypothetical protein
MYGLITARGLRSRWALAALFLLAAVPGSALAQGAGKVSMNDFHFVMRNSVGLAPGQTLRVTAMNNYRPQDGGRPVKASLKVFDAASNLLYQTEEVEVPAGGYYSFDVSYAAVATRSVNDAYIFKGATGRIQVGFEMQYRGGVRVAVGDVDGSESNPYAAGFELVNDESGQTVLIGTLLPAIQKVR